jgi:phospholipase/lecithinase/hemolysin
MLEFIRARRRTLVVAAASAAIVVLASCSGSDADTPPLFGKVVALGASETDVGNSCNLVPQEYCTPSPPYAPGKTSNGKLWIEFVAESLGASAAGSRFGGTNFAYSGARTTAVAGGAPQLVPNMAVQLEQYLVSVGYVSSPQTLYLVDGVSFGNDAKDALTLAATDPTAPTRIVTNAVTSIVTIMQRLYASGARHIVLLNSTNLGLTPLAQVLGPAAVAATTQLSAAFNGALAQQVPAIKAISPGLNIYTVDVFALSNQAAANPASLGLTNGTEPCLNVFLPVPTLCPNPSVYFYWDDYHGTQEAHRQIAAQALAAIGR